jgi:predicted nucleic acid-binding protein
VALKLLLVDKSAYVRGVPPAGPDDELCLCAITRLEILYSARSAADYVQLEHDLREFRDLRMDAETFAIARGAQRELAARGRHRMALPDLLVAACAQQHSADVLHVDRHYDTLADVLAFAAVRAGSARTSNAR